MARLSDILHGKISGRLIKELPGQIREELDDWDVDPLQFRQEIETILRYYESERGMLKADLNKAKKILTDQDLNDRVRGR
jgi:hypothetical protein